MFIAELFFAAAEVSFFIYLIKKEKATSNQMKRLKLERQSVKLLREALEEDFIPEIEARKNKIIDEFAEKLYNYHFNS
jgi:hypothetical protein